MSDKKTIAQHCFQEGVQIAIKDAQERGDYGQLEMTALADLMQIECIRQNNTDLLEFNLPRGIAHIVNMLIEMKGVSFARIADTSNDSFDLEFANEEEQDKFIQAFEMLSFQQIRAYPTPDIYLGETKPDQQLCQDLIDFLTRVVNSYFGRRSSGRQEDLIKSAWSGAIYYQAKINDFGEFPEFSQLEQPIRCYLVEYMSGYWKFFWSKPGQYGDEGNFITGAMKEDPARNGDRYFNDAIDDQFTYSTTLTLTSKPFQDGRSFIYKQSFTNWIGGFMGSMNPIGLEVIHPSWMRLISENAI